MLRGLAYGACIWGCLVTPYMLAVLGFMVAVEVVACIKDNK